MSESTRACLYRGPNAVDVHVVVNINDRGAMNDCAVQPYLHEQEVHKVAETRETAKASKAPHRYCTDVRAALRDRVAQARARRSQHGDQRGMGVAPTLVHPPRVADEALWISLMSVALLISFGAGLFTGSEDKTPRAEKGRVKHAQSATPDVYPMAVIPAGEFTLGSHVFESQRQDDEARHAVVLTQAFLIGRFEVTYDLWRKVMRADVAADTHAAWPVTGVSWCEAADFANRLSVFEGLEMAYAGVERCSATEGRSVTWRRASNGYRLPTEAEWEVAARGGETWVYAGGSNIEEVGWVSSNAIWPVVGGVRAPNAAGLYDMSGNMWEWCWDWYGDYEDRSTDPTGAATGDWRVARGGSVLDPAAHARVAARGGGRPHEGGYGVGLRLARTAQKTGGAAHKALAERLRPGVYDYGFLRP